MKFHPVIIYILFICLGLFSGLDSHAQRRSGTSKAVQQRQDSIKKAREEALAIQKEERARVADSMKQVRQDIADSIAKVRKEKADSTADARKAIADSVAAVRKFRTDSLNWAREKRTDSLESIRKYKESKRYKDSVADARQRVTDSIKAERQAILDAQAAERKRVTDSMIAERTRVSDSIKFVQKQRSDSLAVIRKYKESKRYQDSVAFVRQHRLDSTRLARKAITDSTVAARKRITDSTTAARKQAMDSVAAVRKKVTDSLASVRQARTDSLAKVKEKREKLRKADQKAKEQKMNLALEMKIKQKRQAWSNEKMLKKRWSVPRQVMQNSFTRYNYYFNANNKMNEAVANMQRVNKENYDSMLALYAFNPDKDSSLIAPDMDSIIHKVSVGIQIHDPRVKWGDDLYLLLGRAYYYKGDYENAATAFRYIIAMDQQRKNKKKSGSSSSKSKDEPSIVEEDEQTALDFLKHQSVHNEAIMWLARTFTQADQPENAEAVLDLVASDKKFPEHLKGMLALEKAFLYLNNGNIRDAAAQLQLAANDPNVPDLERQRAAYLSGQIFQGQGDYAASTESFQKALDLHPAIEMDFYARKNIAYNTMYSGEGQEQAFSSLKRILNDNKYAAYYEQVYFILGGLAANSGNSEEAVTYLQKSISSPKSTKKQKAISFASLGNLYYNNHDYIAAKRAYDSSAVLAKSAANDSTVALAVHRSNVLGAVTEPFITIRTQDSLLALAGMSEKEQRAAVRRHIRELEQQRADSIFRAENAGINTIAQNEPEINSGGTSWYFSNTQQMQAGLNDFKRKWGNRPLVDNWRRTSSIGFISNNSNNGQNTEEEENPELDENGLPTEEFLLAAIPTSFDRQQRAHKLIQEAYVELGDAYVMQLEDYPQATQALDTLDVRYKEHDGKAREAYLRYVMALRQNKLPEAQKYAQQLQQQFPQSEYARQVKPTEDGANMDKFATPNTTVSAYYDNAYSLLIQRQYTEVLHLVTTAQQQYKDPKYLKRFRVMEAIAHAGSGNYTIADTMLREFVKNNPSDSLRTWADAVLDYIGKNKPATTPQVIKDSLLNGTVVNSVVKPQSTVNTNTSMSGTVEISQPTGIVPKEYTFNPLEEHYCLFSFPGMEPRAMGVKAALGDFNTFKFANANLVANIDMLSPQQGVIVVKKFANSNQAKLYMNNLRGTAQVFRDYQSSEYQLFIISAKNYQKVLSEHGIDQYLNFYRQHYK